MLDTIGSTPDDGEASTNNRFPSTVNRPEIAIGVPVNIGEETAEGEATTSTRGCDDGEASANHQFPNAVNRLEIGVPVNIGDACPEATAESEATTNARGFVIVGDNLDKNLRPSHQREDRQTQSLHVFHSCAIKNRVDISSLSDKPASAVLSVDQFLLSKDDVTKVLKEFEVLVSRFVVCMLS